MTARVWKFGDNIDTDVLAPGLYMKGPVEELAKHCLESVDPDFASNVSSGDIVVGGRNFGMGSSREQAAQALKMLGVGAIVAESFAGIFYRNAFNLGLLALASPDTARINTEDQLAIHPSDGRIDNLSTGETLRCDAVPEHLMQIVTAGGLVPYLETRFKEQA